MANVDEIFSFLKEQIEDLIDVDIDALTLETDIEQLDVDSLDRVQIQIAVKRKYGVEIAEDRLIPEAGTTVGDLCNMIAASRA